MDAVDSAPSSAARAAACGLGLAVPALAIALYFALGDPAAVLRDGEAAAPIANSASAASLAAYVREHPRDARAWVLLGRAQSDL